MAAVVAMQGNVTMATAAEFFDAFFASLAGNGVVDYAMAVARGKVRDRADWWAPVLFSRLKRGRAWYQPEFGAESAPWQALVSQIKNEHCTPVVGPGLSSRIIGTRQEVARRWVERWQMPLAPHNLDDLAKVAQYLKVFYAKGCSRRSLRRASSPSFGSSTRCSSRRSCAVANLEKIYEVAGEWLRQQPDDPYTALAKLPLPIYITTGWNRLLEAALDEVGRPPIVEFFDRTTGRVVAPAREQPSVEHPLVYHLFGHFGDDESLVLSEDDYFQWLTAWIKQSSTIPDVVKTAMTSRLLPVPRLSARRLGTSESFSKPTKSFEGSEQLRDNVHVGVQLNPESSSSNRKPRRTTSSGSSTTTRSQSSGARRNGSCPSSTERQAWMCRPPGRSASGTIPTSDHTRSTRGSTLFGRDREATDTDGSADRRANRAAPCAERRGQDFADTSRDHSGSSRHERFGDSAALAGERTARSWTSSPNRYVWSAVVGLLNSGPMTPPSQEATPTSLRTRCACARNDAIADHVLIFDQFEEILSLIRPTGTGKKSSSTKSVRCSRTLIVGCSFSRCQDYMGGLDRFLGQVPTHFETRFRLDFLERETQAIAAIRGWQSVQACTSTKMRPTFCCATSQRSRCNVRVMIRSRSWARTWSPCTCRSCATACGRRSGRSIRRDSIESNASTSCTSATSTPSLVTSTATPWPTSPVRRV